MANIKISELTDAGALTGTEVLPIVQSNTTVKTTVQDIANLASGGGGLGSLDIAANGAIGGPYSVEYTVSANFPQTVVGTFTSPVLAIPSITMADNSVYGGGIFTATNLEFPTLLSAVAISVTMTSTLQILSAPLLTTLSPTFTLSFINNSALTTVNFPSLVTADVVFGGTPLLTTVNFPLLETSTLKIENSDPGITGFRQSMFPALRKAAFNFGYSYLEPFEIDFPLLTDLINNFVGGSPGMLSRINLPGLVNISQTSVYVTNMYTLSNVILGTVGVLKTIGLASPTSVPYIDFQNCSLNQASVDNILTVFASLDGTNGTTSANDGAIYLQSGTNASPSSTGLAAKAVLQGRGWYIANN
jgi:hypothetical protein